MTIEDFLDILEERDLIPRSIVAQLRAKVEKGDRRITPKSVLKYLVKKEYVTQRQAKVLLETTLTVSPHAESSILGMAMTPQRPPPNTGTQSTGLQNKALEVTKAGSRRDPHDFALGRQTGWQSD